MMNPLTQLKQILVFLVALGFACFGLSPSMQAVSPAPDGGYPGGNTAEGTNALLSLTSGVWNVAVGFEALKSDTTGNQNTATGYRALFSNVTGNKSTAYGSQALFSNTTGNDNVATGFGALYTNTTGNRNTGVGYRTLLFNNGDDNTAIGWNALYNNRTGFYNTATGSAALISNFDGGANTAIGFQALYGNTSGGDNTAVGLSALYRNIDGFENTGIGENALSSNMGGSHNTAIGWDAGSAVTGNGNICIGSTVFGDPSDNGTIRIGGGGGFSGYNACYISGIYGKSVDPGTFQSALIDGDGKLGTMVSSRRFKRDIEPMEKTSEAVLALKPVTFHYKSDAKNTRCFGLIAEEVAEVNPDLVLRDKEGNPYTVRYDQVNAMLLNEFLKEHRRIQEQDKRIEELTSQLKEQAAQIQKVSAQFELSKAAPQTVKNND